jgi:hypothetical protein
MSRKNQEIRSATGSFWRRRWRRRPQSEAEEEAGTGEERGTGTTLSSVTANSIWWPKRRRDRKESEITGELARCRDAACGPMRRFDPWGTGGQHAPDALAS